MQILNYFILFRLLRCKGGSSLQRKGNQAGPLGLKVAPSRFFWLNLIVSNWMNFSNFLQAFRDIRRRSTNGCVVQWHTRTPVADFRNLVRFLEVEAGIMGSPWSPSRQRGRRMHPMMKMSVVIVQVAMMAGWMSKVRIEAPAHMLTWSCMILSICERGSGMGTL